MLNLEALDPTGAIFDSMTLGRVSPSSGAFRASWHSPVVESQPADDGDGNLTGQRFDFIGTPIPAVTGQFSNLGQVYVNNDRTHLYVGVEQCMIYPNNDIFLFIESPRLTGVTNLLSIGNGLVDPGKEGADGLDFLENLSFTNFAPSVGCILGDEYADSQARSSARPGSALNSGQGVFRLDPTLSNLPGVRFQQFNRTPQSEGVPGEQNANFIELAVPYQALGNLQPGDTIRIGAVVGGADSDTNLLRQRRQLDSGFLGRSLRGSGLAPTILEGVPIELALDPDPDADGLTNLDEARLGTDPAKADTDGDGLEDGWEVAHALNPLSAQGHDGARGDPDGEGFLNWQEQVAGTDPRDPRSALRVSLVYLRDGKCRLSWPAVIGKKYQIEISINPLADYSALNRAGLPFVANSTNAVYVDDLGTVPPPARFFRLRLVP
jgi:hypothetical protein